MKYPTKFTTMVSLILAAFAPAQAEEPWSDLLADGLSAWEDSRGWKTAAEVQVNPANPQELIGRQAGKSIAMVERKSPAAYLHSKESHADVEAVIEFMVPQGSNSGVYFMGRYEVQIFDSFGKTEVGFTDCGAIYQRGGANQDNGHPPLVNASTAPGTWQKFEVIFQAPRFDANGRKTTNAKFVKVVHNGTLVQENAEVNGPTRAAMNQMGPEVALGPLRIQGDHGAVAFRTIKFRSLKLP